MYSITPSVNKVLNLTSNTPVTYQMTRNLNQISW